MINNKYNNGKIYKIIYNDITNNKLFIYIGSTIQTLYSRISKHKYDYKRYLNNKYCYVSSFEIIKNNNYQIELIEYYKCNNNFELRLREQNILDEYRHQYKNDNNVIIVNNIKCCNRNNNKIIFCDTCKCNILSNSLNRHNNSYKHLILCS